MTIKGKLSVDLDRLRLPVKASAIGSLQDLIYGVISDGIAVGRLKPGERLPPERQMAEYFGVSRITITRALDRLGQAGLVLREQGRGTFIQEPNRKVAIAFVSAGPAHPALFQALAGMAREINKTGGYLRILGAFEGLGDETELVRRAIDEQATGLIVYPGDEQDTPEIFHDLVKRRFPVVAIDRCLPNLETDAVVYDDAGTSEQLCREIFRSNHRRIAILPHHETRASSVRGRIQGVMNAAESCGLGPDSIEVWEDVYCDFYPSRPDLTDSAVLRKRLLARVDESGIDAFFAINGDVADRMIPDLDAVKHPTQFSIGAMSHRTLPMSTRHKVLTAYETPECLGAEAARVVLDKIASPTAARRQRKLELEIALR